MDKQLRRNVARFLIGFIPLLSAGCGQPNQGISETQDIESIQPTIISSREISIQPTVIADLSSPDNVGDFSMHFASEGQVVHRVVTSDAGTGYAYQLGQLDDGGFAAVAGLLPMGQVAELPTSGIINYDATYQITTLERITTQDGIMRADTGRGVSGAIQLTANFADAQLSGSSAEASGPNLVVDGQLDENGLSGQVTFRGLNGNMLGVVSTTDVVGAFSGSDDTAVFAGGFLGSAE